MDIAYYYDTGKHHWVVTVPDYKNNNEVTLTNKFLPILIEEVEAKVIDLYPESTPETRQQNIKQYVEIEHNHAYLTSNDKKRVVGIDIGSYLAIHEHTGYDVCKLDTIGVILPKDKYFYESAAKDMLAYIHRWHSDMYYKMCEVSKVGPVTCKNSHEQVLEEMEHILEKYK